MQDKAPKSRILRLLLGLVRWCFRLILAVIILAAVILTVVQTPPGKILLARLVSYLASTPTHPIRFRRLSGVIPFRVRLGEIRFSDPGGDWLVIEDARVRFHNLKIIAGSLSARQVEVERVVWHRLPSVDGDDPPGEGAAGGGGGDEESFTPAWIPSFTVDRLLVRKAVAAESLFGRRVEAAIEGKVANSVTDGPRAELVITPFWRINEQLTVSAASAADLSHLAVELKLDEQEGGELSSIILPGATGPLVFRFRAAGPWEGVKTVFSLRDPARYEVNGNLVLDLDRILLQGDLTGRVEEPPFPGWKGEGELTARFTAGPAGQNLSAQLEANGLAGPFLELSHGRITAELADLFGAVRGGVAVEASGAHLPPSGENDPDPGDLFSRLTGRLALHSAEEVPGADLALCLEDFSIPGLLLHPQEIRTLNLKGRLAADRMDLDLRGQGDRGFSLEADLAAGVSFATDPFSLELPPTGKLEGTLSASVDLSFFNNLLALSRQTLGGVVEVNLTLDGVLGAPRPTGVITVRDGEYQNLNTGTLIYGGNGRVRFSGDRLVVEEFSARTPAPAQPLLFGWTRYIPGIRFTPLVDRDREITGEGRITLSGWTRLYPHRGWPSSYTLILTDALLVDSDIVTAVVSGRLNLIGSRRDSSLKGVLALRRAEGRIPSRLAPAIREIEVIEINKPGEKEELPPPVRSRPWLGKMALDLKLTAPNNVLIKGRGLDSEWRASVDVTGTAANPKIRGGLNLVDGIFIFMGEEMELEEGSVMMDGGYPPDPQLKITARADRADISMTLQLVGKASQPKVDLSSQPPYPDDEILARLLYGRPVSQLSGVQAIQLANGLRVLQGRADFVDLLYRWTSFLGNVQVDVTDLEGTGDQTAVRVRWSLSRNFYIENQRSIESPDNLFLARWEMIKNLELRLQSGYSLLGDAAFLHWQMNY